MTNFCKMCHFESDYEHSHNIWVSHKEKDVKNPIDVLDEQGNFKRYEYKMKIVWEMEKVKDGIWTDQNKMCLPCQAMRGFKTQ